MQLVLQFLDTKEKLTAARCSRRLLQAADHPFAWQGPSAGVSSYDQPQLGSLIGQSLLRHAPITLRLGSDLPAAEVAAIPRLSELILSHRCSADVALELLALPSLKGLQRLWPSCPLPLSTLQLLPSLPALRTLEFSFSLDDADCSWLPAMGALTDLDFTGRTFQFIPLPLLDAMGRCTSLRLLRLRDLLFDVDSFARLSPAPLRRLELCQVHVTGEGLVTDDTRAAFSALDQLESLCLERVNGVDRLLPHLAHAPALRSLTIRCAAEYPDTARLYGATQPSREALARLLAAAPLLAVRLSMATSIDQWRDASQFRSARTSDREGMMNQWHELQRMVAELERVVIVDPAIQARPW